MYGPHVQKALDAFIEEDPLFYLSHLPTRMCLVKHMADVPLGI